MQQENDISKDWKRNINIAFSLMTMHQRALVVPVRRHFGTQALAFPCLFALGLIMLWYVATADPRMLAYMGFWLLFLVVRRIEAVKIAGQVHSHYDGMPINLGSDERKAKMYYEPLCVGILGGIFFWIYTENGLRTTGLPSFLMAGIVSLPFVEGVKQTLWQRRIQGMRDAQLDQEMVMEEFNNRR